MIMAKLADGMPLLSASTQRTLADKLYEKRKNAAREVCVCYPVLVSRKQSTIKFRFSVIEKISLFFAGGS